MSSTVKDFKKKNKNYIINIHAYMCDCSGHYHCEYSDEWELVLGEKSIKINKPSTHALGKMGGGVGTAVSGGVQYPAISVWQEIY